MKKLNLRHAFKISRIIKTAGIKKEVAEFAQKYHSTSEESINIEEAGLEFILTLITSADLVEKQIYELIADVAEMKPDEIAELSWTDAAALIKEIIKENDIKRFFDLALSLM